MKAELSNKIRIKHDSGDSAEEEEKKRVRAFNRSNDIGKRVFDLRRRIRKIESLET